MGFIRNDDCFTEDLFLLLQPGVMHMVIASRTFISVSQEGFCYRGNQPLLLLCYQQRRKEMRKLEEWRAFLSLSCFFSLVGVHFLPLLLLFFCCVFIFFLLSYSCPIMFSVSLLCFLPPLFIQEEIFSPEWRKGIG